MVLLGSVFVLGQTSQHQASWAVIPLSLSDEGVVLAYAYPLPRRCCQDGDAACVCELLMSAGGTNPRVCGGRWRTVVARNNGMAQAWCRSFSVCGVTCALDPHEKQLPMFPRAAGLRALPAHQDTTTIHGDALPSCLDPPAHDDPQSNHASAMSTTLHGTQAPTDPSRSNPTRTSFSPAVAQSPAPRTALQVQPMQQRQQQI